MNSDSSVIEIKNVSFSYLSGPSVLEDVSLSVQRGELLAILGPNGGGKSTLLKLLLGILTPTSGKVQILGTAPAQATRRVGYVPQFVNFNRNFPISVREVVEMGRIGATTGNDPKKDQELISYFMKEFGIDHLAERRLSELSGGQIQRTLLARALVSEPELLLLDEPTASVDPGGEVSLFDWLKEKGPEITAVVVSHDVGFVLNHIEKVACLNRKLWSHSTSHLTDDLIQKLYGKHVHYVDHKN